MLFMGRQLKLLTYIMCILCMDDCLCTYLPIISIYKGYLIFKELLKRPKSTHTKPQNSNTVFMFPHLKTPSHIPKASYSSITDSNNFLLPNSHTNDKSFTKFVSELSALINPLIKLLTVVLNQQLMLWSKN